ncbi:hypothetical protein QQ045_026372 [Rhodiola kirilowii]
MLKLTLHQLYLVQNTLVDVKVDTASTIATTFTLADMLPSTKALASLKLPECSCKLEVQYQPDKFQYLHDIVAFTAFVAHKQSTGVDFSASIDNSTFASGVQASYDTSNGKIKYSTGTEATTPDYSCSVVFIGVTLDSMKVSVAMNVGKQTTLGIEFHMVLSLGFPTYLSTVTIRCSRILYPLTTVKVKLNNVEQFAVVLRHEFIPKSMLIVPLESDIKALDRTPNLVWHSPWSFEFKPRPRIVL